MPVCVRISQTYYLTSYNTVTSYKLAKLTLSYRCEWRDGRQRSSQQPGYVCWFRPHAGPVCAGLGRDKLDAGHCVHLLPQSLDLHAGKSDAALGKTRF